MAILSTLSLVGLSQTDSTKKNDVFCLNNTIKTIGYTINTPRLQTYYQPTTYVSVNLRLSKSQSGGYKDEDTRKTAFVCLLLSGLAFTTAAILEGGTQYGTWQPNPQPGNPYNYTYVTPPVWQQTPRNIMFVIGVGFTLTGTIGLASK